MIPQPFTYEPETGDLVTCKTPINRFIEEVRAVYVYSGSRDPPVSCGLKGSTLVNCGSIFTGSFQMSVRVEGGGDWLAMLRVKGGDDYDADYIHDATFSLIPACDLNNGGSSASLITSSPPLSTASSTSSSAAATSTAPTYINVKTAERDNPKGYYVEISDMGTLRRYGHVQLVRPHLETAQPKRTTDLPDQPRSRRCLVDSMKDTTDISPTVAENLKFEHHPQLKPTNSVTVCMLTDTLATLSRALITLIHDARHDENVLEGLEHNLTSSKTVINRIEEKLGAEDVQRMIDEGQNKVFVAVNETFEDCLSFVERLSRSIEKSRSRRTSIVRLVNTKYRSIDRTSVRCRIINSTRSLQIALQVITLQATLETSDRRENPSSEIEGSITSLETALSSLRADEISNSNVAPSPSSSSPTVALATVSAFPRSIEALETAARETIEQAMPVWQEQTKLSHDSASMDAKISSVLAQLRRDYNNNTNNNNNTIDSGNTNSRTYNNYPATAPKVASGATAS